MAKIKQIIKQSKKNGSMNNHRAVYVHDGVPGATRTPDPLLRRQLLYPTELQGH